MPIRDNDMLAATSQVAVALLGARCHYAVPRILAAHGKLAGLYTDIYAGDWPARLAASLPRNWLPQAAQRLVDRSISDIDPKLIHTFPIQGLCRAWTHSRQKSPGQILRRHALDNRAFCKRITRYGIRGADAMYVYNGAGVELLRFTKAAGLAGIQEQTIAPYSLVEPLLAEERILWPGWEDSLVSDDDWKPLSAREEEEWSLADRVICGSQFVVDGIQKKIGTQTKCVVVPYGIDLPRQCTARSARGDRPLRVLFLGTVELRKGIQYLMLAARSMIGEAIQFRAVGPIRVNESARADLNAVIDLVGSVPRSQLMEHLEWADVLVLPTLAEGSAIVVYEALAAGLPVITTPNAGAVIGNGIEGFIVPVRDSMEIVERLRLLIDCPPLIEDMSAAAIRLASDFTLSRYGDRLLQAIHQPVDV